MQKLRGNGNRLQDQSVESHVMSSSEAMSVLAGYIGHEVEAEGLGPGLRTAPLVGRRVAFLTLHGHAGEEGEAAPRATEDGAADLERRLWELRRGRCALDVRLAGGEVCSAWTPGVSYIVVLQERAIDDPTGDRQQAAPPPATLIHAMAREHGLRILRTLRRALEAGEAQFVPERWLDEMLRTAGTAPGGRQDGGVNGTALAARVLQPGRVDGTGHGCTGRRVAQTHLTCCACRGGRMGSG